MGVFELGQIRDAPVQCLLSLICDLGKRDGKERGRVVKERETKRIETRGRGVWVERSKVSLCQVTFYLLVTTLHSTFYLLPYCVHINSKQATVLLLFRKVLPE